jgi:hypothetical protein
MPKSNTPVWMWLCFAASALWHGYWFWASLMNPAPDDDAGEVSGWGVPTSRERNP